MMKGLLAQWKVWGLPAFVTALSPLFAQLIDVQLISAWHQPRWGIIASGAGAVAAMVSYALARNESLQKRQRRIKWTATLALVALVICVIFDRTVGQAFTLSEMGFALVHTVWTLVYMVLFAALGATIMVAYLVLARPPKGGAS